MASVGRGGGREKGEGEDVYHRLYDVRLLI